MKKYRWILPLVLLFFILLSCEETGDLNFGIGIETCDHKCGENPTCQTSRGDMEKKEKVSVSFPYGSVYQDGTRDYAESLKSVNATLTITVEGEGSVKITVKPISGSSIIQTASSGNPVVITTDFQIKTTKEKSNNISDAIESAEIVGIQVETVDGPATGVQLNLLVNDCTDPWCASTHPNCQ